MFERSYLVAFHSTKFSEISGWGSEWKGNLPEFHFVILGLLRGCPKIPENRNNRKIFVTRNTRNFKPGKIIKLNASNEIEVQGINCFSPALRETSKGPQATLQFLHAFPLNYLKLLKLIKCWM